MARLFGRLNNLSYRGGETETANVVIDGGVIKVDVVGSPQDVTGAYIIGSTLYIRRQSAEPLEVVLPLPQPDLAETNTESLAFVKNKKISYLENDKDYITTSGANKAYIKKVTVNNVEVPILDNDIEQVAQLLVGEGLSVGVNAVVSVDTSKIATNKYVDSNTAVVTENITQHKNDYNNPHKVTKAQVGLDKADNTADIDKPISTATKTALDTLQSGIEAHIEDSNNPHQVTAEQVGLGNVNNTSDMDKPVSTSQQQALDTKVDKVEGKGLSTEDFTTELKNKLDGVENDAQVNTITGVKGNAESEYRVGNVNITKENIGLGNVNNTSDENKPISIAQQEALDTKTNVMVNGEHVDTFNADTKLDKITSTGLQRAYIVTGTGEQSYKYISVNHNSDIASGYIVTYGSDSDGTTEPTGVGKLIANTPEQPYHVATKKYVDDIGNAKVSKENTNEASISVTNEDSETGTLTIKPNQLKYSGTRGTLLIGTDDNGNDAGLIYNTIDDTTFHSHIGNTISYIDIGSSLELSAENFNTSSGVDKIGLGYGYDGCYINAQQFKVDLDEPQFYIGDLITKSESKNNDQLTLVDNGYAISFTSNGLLLGTYDGAGVNKDASSYIEITDSSTIKLSDGSISLLASNGVMIIGKSAEEPYLTIGTGNQVLVDTPTVERQVANKEYVDSNITALDNTKQNKLTASNPIYISDDGGTISLNFGGGLYVNTNSSNILDVDWSHIPVAPSSPLYINGNSKLSLKCSSPLYIDNSNDNKLSIDVSQIAGDGLTYNATTTELVVDFNEVASNITGDGLSYNSTNHTINSDFNAIASNITYTKKLAEASNIAIDSSKLITLMAEPSNSISFANVSWVELTVTQTADSTYTGWGVQYESSSGSVPESFTYKVVSDSASSNVSASIGTIVTTTIIR